MIIPVRCFTCGKVIGNLWNKYNFLKKEKSVEEALDDLKLHKMCCRRMMITHVNLIDDLISYNKHKNTLEKKETDKKKKETDKKKE
jgi:DNA-directed RNA polymerase I, II, and III subunit RPABC5